MIPASALTCEADAVIATIDDLGMVRRVRIVCHPGRLRQRCTSLTNSTTATGAREPTAISPQSAAVSGTVCRTSRSNGI